MGSNQIIQLQLPDSVKEQLKRLEEKLDLVLSGKVNVPQAVGEYVSEKQVMELIGKRTTWLYYKRRDGYLTTYKVGQKNFYKLSELQKLIENGKV